jgi:hypothetical protein
MSQQALEEILRASEQLSFTSSSSSSGKSSYAIPSPLMFELLNVKTNVKVYGSVREFTAEDPRVVEVGVTMAENLGWSADTSHDEAVFASSSSVAAELSSSKIPGATPMEEESTTTSDLVPPPTTTSSSISTEDGITLRVKLVSLPKCHYLKIAPLEADYLEIPDIRYAHIVNLICLS